MRRGNLEHLVQASIVNAEVENGGVAGHLQMSGASGTLGADLHFMAKKKIGALAGSVRTPAHERTLETEVVENVTHTDTRRCVAVAGVGSPFLRVVGS